MKTIKSSSLPRPTLVASTYELNTEVKLASQLPLAWLSPCLSFGLGRLGLFVVVRWRRFMSQQRVGSRAMPVQQLHHHSNSNRSTTQPNHQEDPPEIRNSNPSPGRSRTSRGLEPEPAEARTDLGRGIAASHAHGPRTAAAQTRVQIRIQTFLLRKSRFERFLPAVSLRNLPQSVAISRESPGKTGCMYPHSSWRGQLGQSGHGRLGWTQGQRLSLQMRQSRH